MSYGEDGPARDYEAEADARAAINKRPVRPEATSIAGQITELREAQEQLEETVSRLRDRLTPILLPEEPSAPSGVTGLARPRSDVQEVLERQVAVARALNGQLREILARVDL